MGAQAGRPAAAWIAVCLGLVVAVVAASAARAGHAAGGVPRVDHVVVVVFENHERGSVLGSGAAPTFDALAAKYAQATDYRAVAHPSLPNYLALVSGSTHGVTTDCWPCAQTGPTIGTQLTRRGMSWGAYAEGFPNGASFDFHHVPFLYFPGERRKVHPFSAFDPRKLPAFAFVAPDRCHDMHDCSVSTGDAWLRSFAPAILARPSTLLFVVFDEGTTTIGGGGVVSLVVAGSGVRHHAVTTRVADHYALLRTIEDALGLPPLGAAAHRSPLQGIWRG
ncbi:MAG TPA: alkaline phosphatase family protein [Gaiellaceae bacterium]|jgi:hypothetical protein